MFTFFEATLKSIVNKTDKRFYYLKENCFKCRVLKDSMIHSLTTEKSEEVFQYIEKKHYYGIINENLEIFFLKDSMKTQDK